MNIAVGTLSNYMSYTDIIICFLSHYYQQNLKIIGTFVAKGIEHPNSFLPKCKVCAELAWISGQCWNAELSAMATTVMSIG